MIKYGNSTLKIYIRNINLYTDIDPTVDFVFPVNKKKLIAKTVKKIRFLRHKFEANQMHIQKL